MAKFKVIFEYTTVHQAKKVIEAEDRDAAWAQAEKMALDDAVMGKLDFRPVGDGGDGYDPVEIEPA